MTPYDALRALQDEEVRMRRVRRSLWARLQPILLDVQTGYCDKDTLFRQFVHPLTRAVARGMITEDDAFDEICNVTASYNEASMARWGSYHTLSKKQQREAEERHRVQAEIDDLYERLINTPL